MCLVTAGWVTGYGYRVVYLKYDDCPLSPGYSQGNAHFSRRDMRRHAQKGELSPFGSVDNVVSHVYL